MSADPTDLGGATQPAPEGSWPATPGEFAARWNGMDAIDRQRMVATLMTRSEEAARCFIENHRGELEARRAQVGNVTRLHRHPDGDDPASTYCAHDDETWPCPTMRALGVTS